MLAAGCATPKVEVTDIPSPDAQQLQSCTQLHDALPKKVGGLKERDVTPAGPLVAAWGKPAAVLRCGVGVPSTYRPGVDVSVVNGVGWFEDDRPDDVVYTTVTRRPRVSVAVPRSQSSGFDILVDLSGAVGAHSTDVGVS